MKNMLVLVLGIAASAASSSKLIGTKQDCCRYNGASVGVGRKYNGDFAKCEAGCKATKNCNFLSYNKSWKACVLCSKCDLSSKSHGRHYNSWEMIKAAPAPTPAPTNAPTNTGSVNAQPCTLKAGENTCSTTVTWTSSSPSACIYVDTTKLFACSQSGSQVVPWISKRPLDFVLHESRSPDSLKLGSAVGVLALQAPAPTESVDVEMVIDETMESFTEDKKESLRDEIASELGLSADEVEITVGTKPNPRSSRRLITGGLLITVTIKIESSTLTEQVDTLASPIFAKKVAAATGIQTAFKAFKPKAGSKICATCKWDGTKVHVVHYTNAQKAGEKGLQHRCYHTRGGKCKCECMSK